LTRRFRRNSIPPDTSTWETPVTRPDLKLVYDRDGLPVESLAAEYWRAASSLRGV